jgi:RNA polymerase sigma factor (sigma-70 family)
MGLALRALSQKHAASERELVAAVRQGDDRAFEELFARYRSRITAYVLGMVRDHARAEDVTQEVFLSALRRLRDTERPIAFKPWIYEIARNACIDEFRRTRRTSEVSLSGDEDAASPERTLVSSQPTPDDAIENKQRLVALRDAFRGLSENHHRVLVMRELEGLSYAEIASRLGMSRPMVESTLFRARRRLGEEYEELSTGRRCQQVCEVVDRTDSQSLRVLGVRARRQVALHLSHCDDCRRYARLAGADEALFRAPSVAEKVAALLPFGWLGRRLAGRAGHGFVGRHMAGASQYLGPMGSSAIFGRVAAAVLVIAAAGGGYAGVNLSHGPKASAHNAAAVVGTGARGPGGPSSPIFSGGAGGAGGPLSVGGATLIKQSGGGGGGKSLRLGLGAAGAGHGPAGTASRSAHHGGSGASGGGGLVSAPSGAGSSPPAGHSGSSQHQLGPVSGIVKKIVSPIVSTVQNTTGAVPKVSLPSVPPVNVPAPPKVQVPAPSSVVNGAGQAVNGVGQAAHGAVNTGTRAVQNLLNP